jgi:hypothetical protein
MLVPLAESAVQYLFVAFAGSRSRSHGLRVHLFPLCLPEQRARSIPAVARPVLRQAMAVQPLDKSLQSKKRRHQPGDAGKDYFHSPPSVQSSVALASRVHGDSLVTVPRLALLAASPEAFA